MGIRETLLHLMIAGTCIGSLIQPIIALLGYMWYSLMRPGVWAWVEAQYNHSLIIAVFCLLGSVRCMGNLGKWLRNPFVWSMLALQVVVMLSIAGARSPALGWHSYDIAGRFIVIALLIPLMVDSLEALRWMILTIGVSLGMVGLKFGLFGVRTGASFQEGIGGYMSDNNTLAFALVIGFPFLWFGRDLVNQWWQKMFLLGLAGGSVIAVIMSQSRGGAIAMAAVFVMVWLRSRRKVAIVVVLAMLCAPALFVAGSRYIDRLSTLKQLQGDAELTDSSMAARLSLNKTGIDVWMRNFWLGVGYGGGNWVIASREFLGEKSIHQVHNNYIQWAADSGVFALLIVCGQLGVSYLVFRRSRRRLQRAGSRLAAYPTIGETAIVGFIVGSTFLSRTDYDVYYYLIMMAAAWWQMEGEVMEPAPAANAVAAANSTPLPFETARASTAITAPAGPGVATGPAFGRPRQSRLHRETFR